MYPTSSTVMYISEPATNRHLHLISSHRVRSTCTTESTSAADASFTTLVLHTGSGADRWNRFLSSVSLEATPFGFDAARNASTVAKWWRGRARAWASPTTAS